MTLKEEVCCFLKQRGFDLKSQEGYHVQIFTLGDVVVIVEEKQSKKEDGN